VRYTFELPPVGSEPDQTPEVKEARLLLDQAQCLLQAAGAGRVEIESTEWVPTYDFVIPGPPVTKGRPRLSAGHRKDGSLYQRRYTPKRTREAENNVLLHFDRAYGDFSVRPPDSSHRWRAEVDAYLPDRRIADVDNLGKLPLDALNKHAWKDDSQVSEMRSRKHLDRQNPRTRVRLYRTA